MPTAVRRAMLVEARTARPRECCGFLLGRRRDVRYAVPVTNAAGSSARYQVREEDHLALRRLLRRTTPALDIIGVYHSHPGGEPRPSAADLAEAHYPDWVHVIVGLEPRAAVRAFRIRRGRAEELDIRLVSSGT
jgi:proteasome lid subunit RPN8/RPN11